MDCRVNACWFSLFFYSKVIGVSIDCSGKVIN